MKLSEFKLPPFETAEAASAFRHRNNVERFATRRFFLFFGVLVFAAHGIVDFAAGGAEAGELLSLRIACCVAMLFIGWLFHRRIRSVSPDALLTLYLTVVMATVIAMTLVLSPGTAADLYPFGLAVGLGYGSAVLVPRFGCVAMLSFGTLIAYWATIPHTSVSAEAVLIHCFFLTVAVMAIVTGSLTRERLERLQARSETRLADLNTDLERSRQRALDACDEAVKANRAKSRFLATVSHELRTPMNAIIGFSELMKEGTFGAIEPDRYGGYINDIHRSGRLLLASIDDLLDVSRLESGKLSWEDRRFSIDEMIEGAVATCHVNAADTGVRLAAVASDKAMQAYGDPVRMSQAVINLITNALKFTEEGGAVTVSQTLTEAGDCAIAVTDNGMGISPVDLKRIREPFQQARDGSFSKRKGGLGLGLAIAGGIIERIGGYLDIESELGVGTTATITIPATRLFSKEAQASLATA